MRRPLLASIMVLWTAFAQAEYNAYFQKFQIWGMLHSPLQKTYFVMAFTNGYFLDRGESALYDCMTSKVSYEQAVAMVDKYYDASPQKWNLPVGGEIISALTVKDGPCPFKAR